MVPLPLPFTGICRIFYGRRIFYESQNFFLRKNTISAFSGKKNCCLIISRTKTKRFLLRPRKITLRPVLVQPSPSGSKWPKIPKSWEKKTNEAFSPKKGGKISLSHDIFMTSAPILMKVFLACSLHDKLFRKQKWDSCDQYSGPDKFSCKKPKWGKFQATLEILP